MTLDDTARVASARFVGNHRSAVRTLPLASFEVDRVTPRLNAASDLPVAHASGGCGCAIRGGCCRELSHVTIKVHLHRKALPDRFHSHDAHPHALHVHKADMEGGRERERGGGGHEVRRLKHEREREQGSGRRPTHVSRCLRSTPARLPVRSIHSFSSSPASWPVKDFHTVERSAYSSAPLAPPVAAGSAARRNASCIDVSPAGGAALSTATAASEAKLSSFRSTPAFGEALSPKAGVPGRGLPPAARRTSSACSSSAARDAARG